MCNITGAYELWRVLRLVHIFVCDTMYVMCLLLSHLMLLCNMSGGRILARFETPAHRFLFPEVPPAKGELQQVQLNKSRKYQVSGTSLL